VRVCVLVCGWGAPKRGSGQAFVVVAKKKEERKSNNSAGFLKKR
jgi:hypothetical protein